ncbi:hypothetical protein B296_00040615, partial [Ensete ventricosum]
RQHYALLAIAPVGWLRHICTQPPRLQVAVVFAHDVTSRGHLARRRCPYRQALCSQASLP